ncbi:ParB/RepB/Spo0J family partition protein [Streptomyces sp. NPDC056652]|uniref:ParB/RepB/Spo0J family partition protein n=1 Tax=Streptomyces sp. NPDC056652 TaxID=3345893 RepID=UPI0036B17FC0
MTRVADQLGTGASFSRTRPVSARRAATAAATGVPTEGVPAPTELPVGLISQNPDNPRNELRNLDLLTQSVEASGVVVAITVASASAYLEERAGRARELDEGATYVVVDGHRRLEAARRAGKATIKVVVDDSRVATDESLLEAAYVANYHRDDMTELEEANALQSLVKFYGSQTKASQRLGMSQSTLSQKLSILKITPDLQADLATGRLKIEHVRNLGKLSPEEQKRKAEERATAAANRAKRQPLAKNPASEPGPAADPPSAAGSDYHGVIIPEAQQTPPRQRQEQTAATADTEKESGEPKPPSPSATALQPNSESALTKQPSALPSREPEHLAKVINEELEHGSRKRLIALLLQYNESEADPDAEPVSA